MTATRKARFSTYASRCIENEIRMQFRRERKSGQTVSLQEALEADGDSALTLADVIQDGFCMEDSCEAAGGCPAAAAAAGHSARPGAADLTAAVRAGRTAAPDPAGDRRAAGHQPQLCFPAGDPRAGTAAAGVGQTQLVFHSCKIFNCNSSSCSKVYRRLKASTSSFLERRGGSPSAFKSLALRSALPGLPESPHSYRSV